MIYQCTAFAYRRTFANCFEKETRDCMASKALFDVRQLARKAEVMSWVYSWETIL